MEFFLFIFTGLFIAVMYFFFQWYEKFIEDGGPLDQALEKTGNSIKAGTRKVVGVAKSVKDYSQGSITKAKLKKREQELEIELLKKKIRKMEEGRDETDNDEDGWHERELVDSRQDLIVELRREERHG